MDELDERTLLHLLSRAVSHILSDIEISWTTEQRNEASERLADVAWRGLILMMRQTLASGGSVILNDVGRFEKTGAGWSFLPAVSLVEAAALPLPPASGHFELARQTMFHLGQASELLSKIPQDLEVPASPEAIEASAILSVPEQRRYLSTAAREIVEDLGKQAARLADTLPDSATIPEQPRERSVVGREAQAELIKLAKDMAPLFVQVAEDLRASQQPVPAQPEEPGRGRQERGGSEPRERDRPTHGKAGSV